VGTYLTNDKMSPELRARIETSVRGRRLGGVRGSRARRRGLSPTGRSLLRLVLLGTMLACVTLLVLNWRQRNEQLDHAKGALLAQVAKHAPALRAGEPPLFQAVPPLLHEAAADYGGDVLPAAKGSEGLAMLLRRPALYLRAPCASMSAAKLGRVAEESSKDAFVHCLVEAPADDSEAALLSSVRAAYAGALPAAGRGGPVHRLHDVLVAQPFVGDAWASEVRLARSMGDVDVLGRRLRRAQLERAAHAAKSELLIYLLDEPRRPGTSAELDGTGDHMVRVGIVEIASGRTLLRARRRVEPSWISESRRAQFARGLTSCKLAVELRRELSPAAP
jgi:hypothetical protein